MPTCPIRRSLGTALAALLFLAAAPSARAVENIDVDLFNPTISVGLQGEPKRSLRDDATCSGIPGGGCDGEFGTRSFQLATNLPLGPTHVRTEGRVIGWQLFANVRFTSTKDELTFLSDSERKLMAGGVNLAGLWLSSHKNLWLASAGASFAEDSDTPDNFHARPSVLMMVAHRYNDRWTGFYGGAYTFQYGRGIPIPLVGAIWKPSNRWTVVSLLPVLIRAGWKASDDWTLQVGAAVAGNAWRFDNANEFPGQPETLYLHQVEVRLTGGAEVRLGQKVTLSAEAGVAGARRVRISTSGTRSGDDLLDVSPKPAPFLSVGARFTLGESLLDKLGE